MTHHARLGGLSIDCERRDLAEAAGFWADALGMAARPGGARFMRLGALPGSGGLTVEVQVVDHPSRVHLDIAAQDVAAEVARLERLGAIRLRAIEDWVVMEAPTGHRFCVVPASSPAPALAPAPRPVATSSRSGRP